jgi:serine/threonine protein kinase
MLNQRYEIIRQIGRGAFGTATQVKDVKDEDKL